MLEDYTIDYPTSTMDEPFEFEETGHFAAKHYKDQFAIHNFSWINLNVGLYHTAYLTHS